MNKPRRYFLKISPTLTGFRPDVWEHEEGMFIDYDDYASLKTEVERLEKAGDAMALCFNCPTCAKNWHAAKNGGQP